MQFNLEAKKSLGQNFLHNKTIIGKIAAAGDIVENDLVIEIGPGTGELTAGILAEITAKSLKKTKVIAIEKDRRAIPILEERFATEIKKEILQVIEGDFLEMDPETYISGHYFKIIANIPYYITGAIVRKSLELGRETGNRPSKLVFLVQKEVAERIVQRDGKGSILSNSITFYGNPRLILAVAKGNFVPAPKVDSAVISISNIGKSPHFKGLSGKSAAQFEKWFFDILHAGFAHKRKILTSNLKLFFKENVITELPEKIFEKIGLTSKIRAEELSIEQWVLLAETMLKLVSKPDKNKKEKLFTK